MGSFVHFQKRRERNYHSCLFNLHPIFPAVFLSLPYISTTNQFIYRINTVTLCAVEKIQFTAKKIDLVLKSFNLVTKDFKLLPKRFSLVQKKKNQN